MIRIGAGVFAGRILEQPKTIKTRPLTAKVRASIFNRLGDIEGLSVLDAYAGSGAFGIEAASLGASHVTFIEQSRSVAQVIQRNIDTLAVADTTIMVKSVQEAVKSLIGESFDIILADPPYDKLNTGELEKISQHLLGYHNRAPDCAQISSPKFKNSLRKPLTPYLIMGTIGYKRMLKCTTSA